MATSLNVINLLSIKNKIKSRLGELWWYTLILFVAQRLGDVINAVIGIWLVPQYVRQDELGAVLPLSCVGNALAFPLAMFGYIFLKYINVFATRNEIGKLKALLRDTFIIMAILFVGIMLYARYFMPFVFERMRVADGMLGMLVVASSLLSIVSIFFSGALQALKKFSLASMLCLIGAPLRLITLLIFLPIRALSGYFVGQLVPTLYVIMASLFCLRKILFNNALKSTPYLRSDGPLMLRYALPIMLATTAGMVLALVDPFVIRHRLPDLESAAYYMISRFAEIGSYIGLSVALILFPLASEQHEQGSRSQRLIFQSVLGTLCFGLILAVVFWFVGDRLILLVPHGDSYVKYVPHLAFLTLICSMNSVITCFTSYEFACERYAFNYWAIPLLAFKALFLYCIMGITFFSPWLPASWIEWVQAFHPARIEFVLGVIFIYCLTWMTCMTIHLFIRRKFRKPEQPMNHTVLF